MPVEIASAYVSIVPTLRPLSGNLSQIFSPVENAAAQSGENAGGVFSGGFGKILKAGAIVGVVAGLGKAAGAAFSSTFGEAMERQASTAKLSAQLGLSDADSKALGASAGKLYAQAYGDSFEGVTDALTVVKSSLKDLGGADLETATKRALSFSQAFDVDMSRSVQSVSTLIGSGLVKDSTEAFDILTKASQKVPAALREDVLDASDEYSQFFKALGFNGSQAFGALSAASDKGVFGIDKTGDAIKEFTIRATDMSKSSTEAFQSIGLDANQMANDILAGGDTAQGATQKIVDGLLNIQDPATQANTAIALFGTPIEDLGVQNIPAFLASLQGATGGLGDFAGAADEVDAKLGSTIQSKFTTLTRTIEGFGPALSAAFLPVIGPILDGLTTVAGKASEAMTKASEKLTAFIDVARSGEGFDAIGGPDSFVGRVALELYGLNEQISDEIAPKFKANLSDMWGVLVSGQFAGTGSLTKDSPIVGILFTIRDTVQQTFGDLLDTFSKVFDELAPPLMEAFKEIWGAVQPLIPTFLQLFQAFNPVGLLFKAILPLLPQLAGVLGDLAKVLGDGIARTLTAVAPLFQALVDVINRLMPFVTKLIGSLLPPLVSLFDKLAPLLDSILDALLPLVDAIIAALIPAIDALMPTIERVFTFIADTIGNIVTVIGGVIDFITGIFTGDWEKVWTGVKEIFGGIWDQIKNIFSTLWDVLVEFFTNLGPKLWEIITGLRDQLVEWGGQFLGWIWQGMQDLWNTTLFPWFQALPGTVWDLIKAAAGWLTDRGKEFLQWIWDGITAKFEDVKNWFLAVPGAIWGFVSGTWASVRDWGVDMISKIWSGLQDTASTIWNWFLGLPATVWGFVSGKWEEFVDWGKGIVNRIVEGIKSVAGTVKQAILDLFNFNLFDSDAQVNNLKDLAGGGSGWFGLSGGARGAVVPGVDPGRRDNKIMAVRSGEAIMVPEWTNAIGGAPAVHAMNRAAEQGRLGELLPGIPGFARGGVFGDALFNLGANAGTSAGQAMIEEIKRGLSMGLSGGTANSSQDPSSFGWVRGQNIVPYSWNGTPIVGGVAGGTQSQWASLLSALVPNIPGGITGPIWGYENRNIAGSGTPSFHSYGLAIDVNAPQNGRGLAGYGRSGTGVIPGELAHSLAGKLGMEWGGDWDFTDPMHFEIHTSPGATSSAMTASVSSIASKFISQLGGGVTAASGGSGVERWRSLGLQALSAVGAYKGMNLTPFIGNMMNQIRTESGGDPNAINTTDINAQRGDPSIGLLQVIGSTFRSALSGTPFAGLIAKGQRDPYASLVASTLYSLNRYGSLDRAWRGVAYDQGGWLQPGGQGVNLLNKPEAVLTPAQSDAYISHARALQAGYAGLVPDVTVNVSIDGQQLDARTEVIVDRKFDRATVELEEAGMRR